MPKASGWRRGSVYCSGRNKDGSNCGNKVPTTASGVYLRSRYCHVHRQYANRKVT